MAQVGEFLKTAFGLWYVRLVIFVLPPAFVLLNMNLVWSAHIANIGCIGSGGSYKLQELYVDRTAPSGCRLADGLWPDDRLGAIELPAADAAAAPPVAVADGRFQWMTFHLIALVLFFAVAAICILIIYRNLGTRWRVAAVIAAGAGGGIGWALYSLAWPSGLRMDTASLLLPTRIHALSHFDESFRNLAWLGVQWDYGGGLAVTILLVVAAGSILAETGRGAALTVQRIEVKRRDLKLVIATGAILMTFLAFYVGEWLAWPARFAPDADVRGGKDEFEAVAAGLRLYFGTGYSLALIAFAVPAILALPAPARTAAASSAAPDARALVDGEPAEAEAAEAEERYLYQSVFSKEEFSMLLSVMTPFLATLAGGALQL